MKIRLALMICLLAVLLCGCSYWVVEDAPVQVGQSTVQSDGIYPTTQKASV